MRGPGSYRYEEGGATESAAAWGRGGSSAGPAKERTNRSRQGVTTRSESGLPGSGWRPPRGRDRRNIPCRRTSESSVHWNRHRGRAGRRFPRRQWPHNRQPVRQSGGGPGEGQTIAACLESTIFVFREQAGRRQIHRKLWRSPVQRHGNPFIEVPSSRSTHASRHPRVALDGYRALAPPAAARRCGACPAKASRVSARDSLNQQGVESALWEESGKGNCRRFISQQCRT